MALHFHAYMPIVLLLEFLSEWTCYLYMIETNIPNRSCTIRSNGTIALTVIRTCITTSELKYYSSILP